MIATPTGVELEQLIHEELLKSAEHTGIWEKKLREIEERTYDARQFLEELKQMVQEVVHSVLSDNSNRRITIQDAAKAEAEKEAKEKKEPKKRAPRKPSVKKKVAKEETPVTAPIIAVGQPCPLCGKGTIIQGKTAYGCSEWKSGCTFRKPLEE